MFLLGYFYGLEKNQKKAWLLHHHSDRAAAPAAAAVSQPAAIALVDRASYLQFRAAASGTTGPLQDERGQTGSIGIPVMDRSFGSHSLVS